MEISGQIEEIIYQNEVNGYTIASFITQEEETTIVGYLPFIGVGDSIKAIGKFVIHQEYGRQFKIDTFEKIIPQTLDALEKYLSNGIVKGIGPATAKKIIKNFGEETISIFKFEPERLSQIKGITKQKAIEIGQSFNENWELWQIVGFLEKFGIGPSSAKKIHNLLGNDTITQIESNPYILIDLVRGVDFKQIDKAAQNMGMEYNNEKRIASGIKYSLILVSYNGNTCVIKDNLIEFVKNLLKVEKEDIENTIINMNVKEEIIIEKRGQEEWVYLAPFYKAETNIAEKLILLQNSKNSKKISNIKKEVKQIEENSEITLSDKQKEAIEMVNENNVSVITGGPGTGKTTIIKTIIDIYKKYDKKVILCAPTGRAAKRMSETTRRRSKDST